jgi:hypothetical protein
MMGVVMADSLIKIDRKVVGKTEHPPNSNRIFVWTDLIKWGLAPSSMPGQPYCAGGVEWTDHKAGAPRLPISSPYYCPSRVQYARAHGLWDASGHYDEADEVFFAWTEASISAQLAEHVGRVVTDDGRVIHTIEFNTSSGQVGSQANGDGVWARERPHNDMVLGVLKYSELLKHVAKGGKVPQKAKRVNPFAKALRGVKHPVHFGAKGDEVRAIQWAVGVPVDGVFGSQTLKGVMHFQRFHQDRSGRGLHSDGVVGPTTVWAILQITHFKH